MSIDPTHISGFFFIAVIAVVPASYAIWAGSACILASQTALDIARRTKHLILYLPTNLQNYLQNTNIHPALVYLFIFVWLVVQLFPRLVVIPALHAVRVGPAYVLASVWFYFYVRFNWTNMIWPCLYLPFAFALTYDFNIWIYTVVWLMLAAFTTTLLFEDSFLSRCIISAWENPKSFVSEITSKHQQAMDFKARKRWNVISSPCNALDADEAEVAIYLLD